MRRRTFLVSAAAVGGGIGLGALIARLPGDGGVATLVLDAAAALKDDPDVRAIGQAYLKHAPQENDKERLIELLSVVTRAPEDGAGDDAGRLLRGRIRQDFEEDRTVSVKGWMLSVTEARIYALAVFIGRDAI